MLRSIRQFNEFFIGRVVLAAVNLALVAGGLYIFRDAVVIPIAASAGMVAATIYMLIVGRQYLRFEFALTDEVKQMVRHFAQLLAIYSAFQIYTAVDRLFASLLPTKSISALAYGLLVASIPRGLLNPEHILITPLSESAAKGHKAVIDKTFFYIRWLALGSIPLAGVMFLLSPFLVDLLFGYGAFSHVDHKLASQAAQVLSLAIPAMFLSPVLFRTFQILDRLAPLTAVYIASILLNAVLNYVFVVILKWGLVGICLTTVIVYTLAVIVNAAFLASWRKHKRFKKTG